MKNKFFEIENIIKFSLLVVFSIIIFKEIVLFRFPDFLQTSSITGEKYISFAYFMQFILELLFICLVIGLAGLVLFGKRVELKQSRSKQNILTSVGFALSVALPLVFLFNPIEKERVAVDSFSRVIGMGLVNDWDVEKVISNFGIFFVLFAVTFGSAFICSNRYLQNSFNEEQKMANKIYQAVLSVNVAWLVFYSFAFFIYLES